MINDYENETENQQEPIDSDIPSVVMVFPIFTHQERTGVAGVISNPSKQKRGEAVWYFLLFIEYSFPMLGTRRNDGLKNVDSFSDSDLLHMKTLLFALVRNRLLSI